jgi:hypothetical protein
MRKIVSVPETYPTGKLLTPITEDEIPYGIADTLYHRFAQDLRRFEINIALTIFRKLF